MAADAELLGTLVLELLKKYPKGEVLFTAFDARTIGARITIQGTRDRYSVSHAVPLAPAGLSRLTGAQLGQILAVHMSEQLDAPMRAIAPELEKTK